MVTHYIGPVMKAAQRALESGNAGQILIWVPEASENTLRNLLEKACCERSPQKNHAVDWYFETVNRLHRSIMRSYCPGLDADISGEIPLIQIVEEAIESGNFEDLSCIVPDIHIFETQQRFHTMREMRNSQADTLAAGREYVSAFLDFITYLYNLSGNPEVYGDKKSIEK